MVNAATKLNGQDNPWMVYRKPDGSRDKLYEPGWAGELDSLELSKLQEALSTDPDLAYWWGWRPGMKRRAVDSIKRVAMYGDPESRAHNVKLVREANRRAKADSEDAAVCVTKAVTPPPPRLGRKRIESWETTLLKLANEGKGLRKIAASLQGEGVEISYRTVGRRLQELRALQVPPVSSTGQALVS
jgi:hypothetical protein